MANQSKIKRALGARDETDAEYRARLRAVELARELGNPRPASEFISTPTDTESEIERHLRTKPKPKIESGEVDFSKPKRKKKTSAEDQADSLERKSYGMHWPP